MPDAGVLAGARVVVAWLVEVEGKATPGPWRERQKGDDRFDPYIWAPESGSVSGDDFVISSEGDHDPADVAAIVALRNAAGPLLALADACGRHFEATDAMSRLTLHGDGDGLEWDKWSARNREARDDMRAAVASLVALAPAELGP